jgi:aspartokinase
MLASMRGVLHCRQVHNFGGTCVSAAERIASAAQLVLQNAQSGDRQVGLECYSYAALLPLGCTGSAQPAALEAPCCTAAGMTWAQCALRKHYVFDQVVVVSAMGAHPSSPVKVTDLLLNMVAKAQRQDEAFLLDLAALQVQSRFRDRNTVLDQSALQQCNRLRKAQCMIGVLRHCMCNWR